MADGPGKVLVRGEDAVIAELKRRGEADDFLWVHLDGARDHGPLGYAWIDRTGYNEGEMPPDALRYIGGDYQLEEGGEWVYGNENDEDEE